ncbi:hypothetical protein [Paraburkholderia fungorum]|jgi:hypothetical protein|uniref:Uncharacterized protein n=1 Tax=Paraburkholderia fungorum TaxID=134537 RepID=A0AAW3V1I4_9BURK|nr:hypothetical protein [Paraburkholderia fungorum]MBB4515788.1 hypothetical protein [Paraburkholderia fungorum]MBB6203796.1 hypothetical protein [Paraburkholderia fungorum]
MASLADESPALQAFCRLETVERGSGSVNKKGHRISGRFEWRFMKKPNKKRCWISIQQRFRLGTECLIVSSFSTCKIRGASELHED